MRRPWILVVLVLVAALAVACASSRPRIRLIGSGQLLVSGPLDEPALDEVDRRIRRACHDGASTMGTPVRVDDGWLVCFVCSYPKVIPVCMPTSGG